MLHINDVEVARLLAIESRKLARQVAKRTDDAELNALLVDIKTNLSQVHSTLTKLVTPEATNEN